MGREEEQGSEERGKNRTVMEQGIQMRARIPEKVSEGKWVREECKKWETLWKSEGSWEKEIGKCQMHNSRIWNALWGDGKKKKKGQALSMVKKKSLEKKRRKKILWLKLKMGDVSKIFTKMLKISGQKV